jgi:hypothetical protein
MLQRLKMFTPLLTPLIDSRLISVEQKKPLLIKISPERVQSLDKSMCGCQLVLMIAVSAAILAHASCRSQQTAATGARFSLH